MASSGKARNYDCRAAQNYSCQETGKSWQFFTANFAIGTFRR
jgi:hypothetical protein